ncbi:hypothetical protein J6590_090438 [Homalodisca vitripennis]|nr:hypothetical protein J6590_090438 [Homalodisca vitripennis]
MAEQSVGLWVLVRDNTGSNPVCDHFTFYQYHWPCTVSTLPLILFDKILAQARDLSVNLSALPECSGHNSGFVYSEKAVGVVNTTAHPVWCR